MIKWVIITTILFTKSSWVIFCLGNTPGSENMQIKQNIWVPNNNSKHITNGI